MMVMIITMRMIRDTGLDAEEIASPVDVFSPHRLTLRCVALRCVAFAAKRGDEEEK